MADLRVCEAVDALGGVCTASTVSLATELSVEAVEDELRALLVKCGGEFDVTGEAEAESVRYRFAPRLRERALAKEDNDERLASARQLGACLLVVFQWLFGAMLLVSLTIVLLCIAAVGTAAVVAHQQQHQGQRRGGGSSIFQRLVASNSGRMWSTVRLWNEITMMYWIFGGQNPFFRPMPPFWSPIGMLLWSRRWGRRGYFNGAAPSARWSSETWNSTPRSPPPPRVTMRNGVAVAVPVAVPVDRLPSDEPDVVASLLVPEPPPRASDDSTVLESIHSFVFGDAMESPQGKWKAVGRFIVSHGQCLVPAQALYPWLDAPPQLGSLHLLTSLRHSWLTFEGNVERSLVVSCAHFPTSALPKLRGFLLPCQARTAMAGALPSLFGW